MVINPQSLSFCRSPFRMFPLFKVLFATLVMHTAATTVRFTATLDAIGAGATTFWVGAMLASISLGPVFLAVPAGRWLDRIGPKRPLVTSIACMMLAGLTALALPTGRHGIPPLFAAAVLTGFSFMLTNVVVQRLTGDVTAPERRRFAFTALSLATATSNLCSPVAAGYVIEHLSCAAAYVWSVAAPAILALTLLSLGMRQTLRGRTRPASAGPAPRGSARDFVADPPMRAVLIASVVISIAWEVGNLLIPIYADSVGLRPSEIGRVLGSFAAATFIVRFLTPILLRYVLEWHMIVLSLALAASAFAMMPLIDSAAGLSAAAFLLGLGLGASLPNMMSLVYLFAPPARIGEAIGLRIMALNLGKSVFPVLAGWLGTVIGAGGSLWALALFSAGGFGYAAAAAPGILARMRALRSRDGEDGDEGDEDGMPARP